MWFSNAPYWTVCPWHSCTNLQREESGLCSYNIAKLNCFCLERNHFFFFFGIRFLCFFFVFLKQISSCANFVLHAAFHCRKRGQQGCVYIGGQQDVPPSCNILNSFRGKNGKTFKKKKKKVSNYYIFKTKIQKQFLTAIFVLKQI